MRPRRVILAVYLCGLLVSTHVPEPDLPVDLSQGRDIWAHLLSYGGLTAVALWAYPIFRQRGIGGGVALALLEGALAAVDEVTQAWVQRSPDLGDWLADMAGVAAVIAAWRIIDPTRRKCVSS